jgi:hypothetical protein
VKVKAVMTDNGSAFKSHKYRGCLKRLGIKHKRTKAYRPQTNGKVERFVRTSLSEWAYERPYQTSQLRTDNLLPFLHHYNYHRPHWGINGQTPASRLAERNNLLEHYTRLSSTHRFRHTTEPRGHKLSSTPARRKRCSSFAAHDTFAHSEPIINTLKRV